MKQLAIQWTNDVLKKMATSKKANAGGLGSIIVLLLPEFMKYLNLSGDPTTAQIMIGSLVALYIFAQGQADHGKEARAAMLKTDVLMTLLTQGKQMAPLNDIRAVLRVAGASEEEADLLEKAVAGNPVASGELANKVAAATHANLAKLPKAAPTQPGAPIPDKVAAPPAPAPAVESIEEIGPAKNVPDKVEAPGNEPDESESATEGEDNPTPAAPKSPVKFSDLAQGDVFDFKKVTYKKETVNSATRVQDGGVVPFRGTHVVAPH